MITMEKSSTRRMRFLSTFLCALLAAAALAGCATNDGGSGTPTPTTTTATATPTSTTPTATTSVIPTLPASGPSDVYGLTTGGATGVYYAIGNGIVGAVRNATTPGFSLEVATSGGSVQNGQRLKADDYQLATMQNDVAYQAYRGEGSFASGAVTELRALGSLYPEMVQLVVLEESGINTLQDLAGKRVVLGAPGSGAAVNAGQILNASGVTAQTQYLDLNTASDRLKDGGVDAVFWTGGIPTGAIVSLGTTHPVRVLPIDGETKANLQAEYPFYANATLPGGTYGGQDGDVETVAVMAILVARSDVPADDMMKLLSIIYDGTAVQQAHAQGQRITLDNAFTGIVGLPWHDGAKAYYASKGKTTPSS